MLLILRALAGIAGVVGGLLSYPTGRIVPADRAVPTALIVVGAIFIGQALLDCLWVRLYRRDQGDADKANAIARAAISDFETARKALDQEWEKLSNQAPATAQAGTAVTPPSLAPFSAALTTLNSAWANVAQAEVPGSAVVEAPSGGGDGPGTTIGVFVAAIATVLGLLAVFGTDSSFAIRLGALVLVIGAIVGLTVLLYASDAVGGRTQSLIAWIMSILFGTTAFGLACIGFAVFFR